MRVILFNEQLYKLDLPSKIDGSFSLQNIPESEEVLANIESLDNNWILRCVDEYSILANSGQFSSIKIENNNFYILTTGNIKKLIYVESSTDTTFKLYKVKDNSDFIIGKNKECTIFYNNNFIIGEHALLAYKNGDWTLKLAPKVSIYINDNIVTTSENKINNGDVIFIYGLKIIPMGNTILINNPQNLVTLNLTNLTEYLIRQDESEYKEVKELDYYTESDYFFKTPRLRRFIETYDMKLASPPTMDDENDMPLILVLGPSLTMALLSGMTLFSAIAGIVSGQTNLSQSLIRIVGAMAMLAGCLLWPNLIRKYNKQRKIEENKKREKKYYEYIDKKKKEMISEGINQSQILKENLISLDECFKIIVNKKRILWERKISQKDFLTVRVGTGQVPIDMDIKFEEDEFRIDDDPLKDAAIKIINENKNLTNVPIGYSFYNKKVTALMGMDKKLAPFTNNIILQLVTFHSYDDLKIVILTDKQHEYNWEVYKNLPHCFSNNKKIRFYATDIDEIKNVSTFLEQEYISRVNNDNGKNIQNVENEDKNIEGTYSPYYLIFTDCFTKVRRMGITELVLKNNGNFGFGFIIIENSLGKLPSECVDFITIGNQTSGILCNEVDNYSHQDFNDEINNDIDMEKCLEILANIPIEFYEDTRYLPKSIGFLEMLNVGKVEQLNSMNRWRLNDPTKSLRAAVGINDLGNIIYLDLHERYHGPHGLIAGMTGSGKSEFIITYILSMAINYSPNEVSFILIDYKGGGLAGAFENKIQNIKLPHLAGTITNLDKAELNRTLVSIDSELRRRQMRFNEARDKLGESTIDIYKYQKYYRQRKLDEPIPHLFIICDEFAELKSQQPEFMDNLISTARIGRSLGVHLILATQKPSGVVNDQIWSNSKFRVCLKVQDRGDSNEMIKKPVAAEIKEPGRFYLQVGYDELFLYGQSGWAGTPYIPSNTVNTKLDHSINYINNVGTSIKDYDDTGLNVKIYHMGDELSNILKYLIQLSDKENVVAPQLWLDNIPENIYIESLIEKYNYVPERGKLEAIIGEYDAPSKQYQGLLKLNLDSNGNTIIYGTSGTNREMFLSSLIYSLCLTHSSLEVNFYIFDFGSESLRIFSDMPHVGDIVFASDNEKVSKLNKMISDEIEKRKKLFVDYNGEYDNYCKNSDSTVPRKVFIFNNLDSYKELYPNCDDDLIKYSREGLRYGIIIIITANSSSGLYSRLLRNFENVFVLDMPNVENYVNILGKIGNIYPTDYEGRGLFKSDNVYEYQTAQIYPKDNLVEYIKKKTIEIKELNPIKAEKIPVLPDVITLDMMKEENITLKRYPFGIFKESLNKAYYNFSNDKSTLVVSNEIDAIAHFLGGIINIGSLNSNIEFIVLDAQNLLEKFCNVVGKYISNDFNNNIENIIKYINNSSNNKLIIILGIDKLKTNVDTMTFNNFINCVKKDDNVNMIISDNSFKLKKYLFEPWYTELVININGIWIGNGIMEQNIIRISELTKQYRERIDANYAWVIKNGMGVITKIYNCAGDDNEK